MPPGPAGRPRAARGPVAQFASGTRRGSVALTSSDAGDGDGGRPRGVGGGGQLATAACAVVHTRSRCNATLNNLMIVPCVDPRMPRAHPCPWSFLKLWTVLRSAMCICCAGFFQSSHDEHNVSCRSELAQFVQRAISRASHTRNGETFLAVPPAGLQQSRCRSMWQATKPCSSGTTKLLQPGPLVEQPYIFFESSPSIAPWLHNARLCSVLCVQPGPLYVVRHVARCMSYATWGENAVLHTHQAQS